MNNQNNLALAMQPQQAMQTQSDLSLDNWKMMMEQANMLVKTNFLPASIKTPEQAVAIMLQGRELGIPTMAALGTINVIQGKPTVSPQLMLALINRSGQLENIEIKGDENGVSCTMKRRNRSAHAEFFGTKEAADMGLMSKDNYKKQAATMFRWRAVAACARTVFPDVILGMYTPDEMGADNVNSDGELLPELAQVHTMPTKTQLVEAAQTIDAEPVFITADEQKWRDEIGFLLEAININPEKSLNKYDSLPSAEARENALREVRKMAIKAAIGSEEWNMSEEGTMDFLASFGIEGIDAADAESLDRCVKSLIKNKHL